MEQYRTYGRYFPWTTSEEFLSQDEYCLFHEVCSFLDDLLLMDFKTKSSREIALEMYKSIKRKKIVSKCQRFPAKGVYFNITCTLFGGILENIVGCLRCKEEGVGEPVSNCDCEEIFKYLLAKLIYGIEVCPIKKRYKKGIFTRKTFERFFQFEWREIGYICRGEESEQARGAE
ncbi:hypothetical protein M0804_007616 [Polistes exclamans]|nr:hypothetical protein M0804_007616 [Polistes exclamans]